MPAVDKQLNVDSSGAKTLSNFGFTAAQIAAAKHAVITVETQNCRYLTHGLVPTASRGILLESGKAYTLTDYQGCRSLRIIATTATAVVSIVLYDD